MLVLSDAITLDLSFRETYLVPLIVIDAARDETGNFINEPMYISTNKGVFSGDIFWEDFDLKISSIKESLDLINRKYKINNLSFTLSNYYVQDKRISDFVADRALLNKTVEVYYKTQSCKTLEDCVLIFKGDIRRFDHDSKSVRVELEDLTEGKLSKELPIANTGFGGNLYNKEHKNQPIPMVYGSVGKAPAIPFINIQAQNDETDINIVCDDVLNADRGIRMGGFFADDASFTLTTQSCPLYIYKESYFLVLPTYTPEAAYEQGEGNFFYDDYEQYTIENDSIKISKKFDKARGLNPPAMNELQTIIRRYPNSMKLLLDPTSGELDSDAWVDTLGYGVHFLNPPIKAPELSFDNPDATLLSPELIYTTNLLNNYKETYAEVPDPFAELQETFTLVHSFRPYGSGTGGGGWDHFTNASDDNYQYQIMNWFHRYAHTHNTDYANPTVTYIRLPRIKAIVDQMGKRLWEMLIDSGTDSYSGEGLMVSGYAPSQAGLPAGMYYIELPYSNIDDVPTSEYDTWLWGTMSSPEYGGSRVNTFPNISPQYAAIWSANSGLNPDPPVPSDSGGFVGSAALFGSDDVNSVNSFRHICETVGGEWGREQGSKVNFPQALYYEFSASNYVYRTCPTYTMEGEFVGNFQHNLKEFTPFSMKKVISTSLHNDTYTWTDNLNKYDLDGNWIGSGLHFELFDTGLTTSDLGYEDQSDPLPYLFNPDDWAQYSPFTRTGGATVISGYARSMSVEYMSLWNGISIEGCPDSSYGQTDPNWLPYVNYSFSGGSYSQWGTPYFGGTWGNTGGYDASPNNPYGWGQDTVYEASVVDSNTSWGSASGGNDTFFSELSNPNNCHWALWIRETVSSDIGTERSPNRPDEYNLDEPANVIVKKNTIMPLQHFSKPKSHNNDWYGLKGNNFVNTGTVLPIDFNGTTLYTENAEDGTSIRLGCVFAFQDLEVADDVKCDTFFEGKIKNRFNEETVNDASKNFVLGCGAIDITEEEGFNWSSFDDATDSDNVPLINIALSECYNNEQSMIEFDSYQHPDNMQEGHTNQFSGNLTDYIIPEFWKPNNYNALTMMYRLDRGGDDLSVASLSTEIYNVSMVQYIIFGAALDSNIYANVSGRVNTMDDVVDTDNGTVFKYTGTAVTPIEGFEGEQEEYDNQTSAISSPFSIIYHILEKEVGIEDPIETSIDQTIGASDMSLAFSLNEKIKAKELINNLCTNTNIFPMFKSTSKFSFTAIKSSYVDDDVQSTIIADEIVKSKFTRTPLEKIYTLVNVKYYKDYETGDYLKDTGYVDGYDCYGNGDLTFRIDAGHLGYSYDYIAVDRETNVFDFEAEFIRNKTDAESLRNFIYMYNCNQHNIFKLTLPLKYLYLEVGDIVRFDKLIENMLAYGEDYTNPVTRNAQTIYPYFIIDSINKKQKSITVKLTQLHNLNKEFSPEIGSVSRCFGVGELVGYNESDSTMLENYLLGGEMYFTNEQKRVSDWTQDGYIDNADLQLINDAILVGSGDINQDGSVNVTDIVAMVSLITGDEPPTDEELLYGDINGDGVINVTDIVATVNQIIGGGDE